MSDLVGNPEDRFSRVAAQLCARALFQVYFSFESRFDVCILNLVLISVWIVMVIGATGGLFLTLIGVVVIIIVKRYVTSG